MKNFTITDEKGNEVYQAVLEFDYLKKCQNPNEIFNVLKNAWSASSQCWMEIAYHIFDFVAEKASNFKKDIAEKASKSDIHLSEKQIWCVAFEFINLTK